jgi:hypothetical protein
MKLLIVLHKLCWRTSHSSSGFASDGGFSDQIKYLSNLFDQTTVLVPVKSNPIKWK